MRIDFHAHILPMADHGCDSLEMARKQLDLAKHYGVSAIVATPHFYPHRHTIEQFAERQLFGAEALRSVMVETDPRIYLGAEVLLCPGIERMEWLERLCIQGTDHVILLELPSNEIPASIWETICTLQDRGFYPVLAHLDRYSQHTVQVALNLGLPVQLNADAFHAIRKRKKWKGLVEQGLACALGSDLHGVSEDTYRQYDRALRFLGESGAQLMRRTEELLQAPLRDLSKESKQET